MNNNNVGVIGVLGIVFVVLKLIHQINWSWLWVLSPFWIPVAIAFVFALVGFLVSLVIK